MSQLSQLSDIIKDVDVDRFIEENGITEDVKHLLNGNENSPNYSEDEEDCKPLPAELFGTASYPQSSHYRRFPPEQSANLGTEEYPGPHNFEVLIVPPATKTPWEYSSKLNKVFIGINLQFPVAFSVQGRAAGADLFIRTTPIYSQSQHFQEFVHRCVAHQHPNDPSNKGLPEHVFQHIVRCANEDSRYCGDKDSGTRLSVVIPLANPQKGCDLVKEFYHFVCKNSCPLGMNRRPVDLIFTLENENGEVLGRRLVSIRICSCPKRDKEKEEKDLNKNKVTTKKRKLEDRSNGEGLNPDTREYRLNLSIAGKSNYLHVLKVCRDRMASEILKCQGETNDVPFRKCYKELCSLIEDTTDG